jgi:hypothetical protein
MKSAYELAMERLEAKSPTQKLTDTQRAEIAEIDSLFQSKIAERRLLIDSEITNSNGNPMEIEALKKQLSSEIRRLEEEAESRKERVRTGNQ